MTHPALNFSPMRAVAWEKDATDEDFMRYIYGMAAIYAKRKYKGDGKLDEDLLMTDYVKWRADYMSELMKEATDAVAQW